MFDAIVGWIGAAVVGALGLFAIRWKLKAENAKKQIDDYQQSSDKWQIEAAKRVEEVKRQADGKAPIDTKNRRDFEVNK